MKQAQYKIEVLEPFTQKVYQLMDTCNSLDTRIDELLNKMDNNNSEVMKRSQMIEGQVKSNIKSIYEL